MKKLFSVLAVLFVLGTTHLFAWAIGPEVGINPGLSKGTGALTFKLDNVPCIFAVQADIADPFAIGVVADWWIANPKIQGTWRYYYGLGAVGSFAVGSDTGRIFVGGRAIIGTNIFLLDGFLEPYLQVAWQPGIRIENGVHFEPIGFPIALGLRFWIH